MRLIIGGLPPGLGDQSLLYQVLENLLANAIKFTKSRKTAVIEAGDKDEENETIYYVKDNGIGFDRRYVDKVYGIFQCLHGREGYEGTGIGLATVKRIIERHDLLKVLVSLSGLGRKGVQFAFRVEDRPGSIKELTDSLRNFGGRIVSILSTYEGVPAGFRKVYIRAYNIDREKLPQLFKEFQSKATMLYFVDRRENLREIFQ